MSALSFTVTKTFACGMAALFSALTDAKSIKNWSGQKGKIPLKVGGKLNLFDGWVTGVVLQVEQPSGITFTWIPSDWTVKIESVVSYSLSEKNGKTKIMISHSGIPDEAQMQSHKTGWKEYVLEPVEAHLKSL